MRPELAPRWMPVLYMQRSRLRGIARRLALRAQGPVVVAGHSAGAAAGTYLALQLARMGVDVRGLVLIDGVDSPNHLIASTMPTLREVPRLRIEAVLAPASPCNRQGALAAALAHEPGIHVSVVPGAGHGDIEGGGSAVYQRACGDRGDEAAARRMLDAVVAAISRCAADSANVS